MARPAKLEAALRQLNTALDRLEAASDRLMHSAADKADLQEGLALMQDDRSRLAARLDAALARSRALEQVTQDVGARLGQTGAVLRRLLNDAERA